jgi:hypothetical protein
MAQTCGKCKRVNPPEAAYCYFDGTALAGTAGDGASTRAAGRPFPSPFVFPSGRSCRTFDELAFGCHEEWLPALKLLRQGYFESFLGGLGRADLALAARDAARFPDPDRGLDQLLSRLPAAVLEAPKLRVSPQEVNLAILHVGMERSFDLHLENRGMRLLFGSISCEDCNWLRLGGVKGASQKHFQFGSDTTIPVHVQANRLRASNKSLEGRLIIDSNGGTAVVTVRAEVPVKPFPEGVLKDARSPRQLAEKAKHAPKEAAELFERGAVARWYSDNGWTYPIAGLAPKGPAAVQQFFEVLGLTIPPKVELREKAVALRGNIGDSLRCELEVVNEEKKAKPVFAHALSNQPWLEVGRASLHGRIAKIPLVVPSVPNREGAILSARVVVIANGNQRFIVPVTLEIDCNLHFDDGRTTTKKVPSEVPRPGPAAMPAMLSPGRRPSPRGRWFGPFRRLLPVALLLLLLSGVICWDAFHRVSDEVGLLDPNPRLDVRFNDTMRFGIVMLNEPDPAEPRRLKRLTFEEDGATNNTCLKVDDQEILFGKSPGAWVRERKGDLRKVEVKPHGWRSVWEVGPNPEEFPSSRIRVTQTIHLVPGEQTRLLDTYLIHYTVKNQSKEPHRVGLRVLLDTFIGTNDGSPFVIPGQPGLLQTMRRFSQKEIPDYVQALEQDNLANPGTVAHVGLKGIRLPNSDESPERPEGLLICRYPGNSEIKWDWEPEPIDKAPNRKDSCVALYWTYMLMNPGETREMAFTYGLNAVSSSGGGQLGLTVGGSFKPGGEFTVTAYVKDAQPNQRVALTLPPGLALADGETAEHAAEAGGLTQVSWRVKAERIGIFTPRVTSGLIQETCIVRISDKGLYD